MAHNGRSSSASRQPGQSSGSASASASASSTTHNPHPPPSSLARPRMYTSPSQQSLRSIASRDSAAAAQAQQHATASNPSSRPASRNRNRNRSRSSSAVSLTESTASSHATLRQLSQLPQHQSTTALRSPSSRTTILPQTQHNVTRPNQHSLRGGGVSNAPLASSPARPSFLDSQQYSDPNTPTPVPRKQSAASQFRPNEYRYSIGPVPVRFPKATPSTNSLRTDSGEPSTSMSSPRELSATSGPFSGAPLNRSTTASTRTLRGKSPSKGQQKSRTRESSLNASQDTIVPPSYPEQSRSTCAQRAASTSTPLGKRHDARDVDLEITTPLQRAPDRRHLTNPIKTDSTTLALPGASSDQEDTHLDVQRPDNLSRPSSKVFTSFPFPHPVTPGGGSDDESKVLGFGWVGKWFGFGGASKGSDEEQGVGSEAAASAEDDDGILGARGDQGTSTYRGEHAPLVAQDHTGRYAADGQQQRQYGTMSTIRTARTAITNASSDEVDPSDPYGYRRLAGPDLLPAYHEEHVLPRRKQRAQAARRERRRRMWRDDRVRWTAFVAALVVLLLLLSLVFWSLAAGQDLPGDGDETGGEGREANARVTAAWADANALLWNVAFA